MSDCHDPLHARGVCQRHYYRLAGSIGDLPITHDCPRCEDGGLVVPYDADERGHIKTYRCVVRGCWTIVREMVNA